MQDVANWKDKLELEQQVQVVDKRDNKTYWVAKLKDGNIWMTQNLDYDLSVAANQTLYPDTSNVATTRTIAPVSWGQNLNGIYHKDGGDIYYIDGTIKTEGYSTLLEDDVNRHYAQGDYYSWRAATAGQGTTSAANVDINESICPAGWRLPTSNSVTASYSFGNLLKQYGYSGSNQTISDAALLTSPLFFTHGGQIDSGPIVSQGNWGRYWSSRAYSSYNSACLLILNYNNVSPSGEDRFYGGRSICCVAI